MSFSDQSPMQIAWVTTRLGATEEALSALLGVKTWIRLPNVRFGPESCTYRGRPADFVVDIALSYAGETQLELIAPVSGESIYTEFLRDCGPGLHHICVETDDIEAAVTEAAANGGTVVQRGTMPGGMDFAYVSASHAAVPYLEIAQIGPKIRRFFDYIKKEQR
jgi:catechol 2,3-dioxygenase-like lactoylglutathione lyase family enzyme